MSPYPHPGPSEPQAIGESPPSYDAATYQGAEHVAYGKDTKAPLSPIAQPPPATPMPVPTQRPGTTVHHYVNPLTGEHVASLLPPDHPQMRCLQEGQHEPQTKYGFLGVLAAIFWFPLGVGICLLDRRVRCRRCGYIIDDGILCG